MGLVYKIGYNLSKIVAKSCFSFRTVNKERIPQQGGMILAMNHQSFLDPPLAGISCDREIYYLARETLLKWPVLGPLFPKLNVIPVAKDRADMSALKIIIRLVNSGAGTVIFPEGTRTRDGNLQPAQPGLGLVIAKTLAPVIPMRVFGAYEAFPRHGRVRFCPITVVVGEPMRFTEEDIGKGGRDTYQQLSARVMAEIARLELPRKGS